jgi:transposase InsO family protein
LLNIEELCSIAAISRSGYYYWLNSKDKRDERELNDRTAFDIILNVYKHRKFKKGSRQIYMVLRNTPNKMSLEKIRRLMRKYGLFCQIRKANPYRKMRQATQTSTYAKNKVQRKWWDYRPGELLTTDITYMYYGVNRTKKAYLSVIRDACTKQVLAFVLSDNLREEFVLETVDQLIDNHGSQLSKHVIITSDQGVHYSAIEYRKKLKKYNITRSMSRRGNCWDNAPQESFFGHMKDEITITDCNKFEELKYCINEYMHYYNNERYQWDICKMTPNQYNKYLRKGHYLIPGKNKAKVA